MYGRHVINKAKYHSPQESQESKENIVQKNITFPRLPYIINEQRPYHSCSGTSKWTTRRYTIRHHGINASGSTPSQHILLPGQQEQAFSQVRAFSCCLPCALLHVQRVRFSGLCRLGKYVGRLRARRASDAAVKRLRASRHFPQVILSVQCAHQQSG